jgi:hypothetical protein
MSKNKGGISRTYDDFQFASERIKDVLGIMLQASGLMWRFRADKEMHDPHLAIEGAIWNSNEARGKHTGLVVEIYEVNKPKQHLAIQFWPRPPGKKQLINGYPRVHLPHSLEAMEGYTIEQVGYTWMAQSQLWHCTILIDDKTPLPRRFWLSRYTAIPLEHWKAYARFKGGRLDRLQVVGLPWNGQYLFVGAHYVNFTEAIRYAIITQYGKKKGA